jgi:hypothetical protein
MNRSDDILPSLMPRGISGMDLLQVLLQHFGSAVNAVGGREVLHPKDPPYALRVIFDNRGEPKAALAEEALTPEALQSLQERIRREFIESAGVGVNRQVYFSTAPIRGWWRYRDQFQVLPVPEHAPKAEFVFLDHPFLLEFRYTRAPDFFLDSCRRTRVASKLALLLNALLVSPVVPLGRRNLGSPGFAWVLLPPEKEGAEPKIAYRQEGYYYDELHANAEDFSDVTGQPAIREVPSAEYYQGERRSCNDPLEAPSDLSESFDYFYALDLATQDRFLNACFWLSQANQAASASISFLAAIQAIETLVDPSPSGAKCPQCGLTKRPGPTHQFVSFLKRYVPSSEQSGDGRRLLYEVRSGLTHGYYPPFLGDTEIVSLLNPAAEQQRQHLLLALTSARIGLRNWLHAAARVSQSIRAEEKR